MMQFVIEILFSSTSRSSPTSEAFIETRGREIHEREEAPGQQSYYRGSNDIDERYSRQQIYTLEA